MDKLVERETATRNPLVAAPALAVQFFLIPLAVVGITVLVYVGFRSLLTDDRTPQDYLSGGAQRRIGSPLAGRLRAVAADGRPESPRRSDTGARARQGVRGAKDDDPRVRQYLALAIGRLDPPLPPEAVAGLTKALDSIRTANRASAPSGRSARRAIRRSCATLAAAYAVAGHRDPQDGRLRARRAAGRRAGRDAAHGARRTPSPTFAGTRRSRSRARHHDGVPVIRQMMDRQYVEQRSSATSARTRIATRLPT